jgi:hypothetical protein
MSKTWGPFTGRQLTAIIVAIIIGAVLVPSAVWAAGTFSHVGVFDATGNNQAGVDASNHLKVGDGSGPLTVDGTVTSHETPLSQLVHYYGFANSAAGCVILATAPAGKAIVLGSATINIYADPTPGAFQFAIIYPDTTCGSAPVADVNPTSLGAVPFSFDPGVSSRTGFAMRAEGGVQAEVFLQGYLVAAASVPASATSEGAAAAVRRPQ